MRGQEESGWDKGSRLPVGSTEQPGPLACPPLAQPLCLLLVPCPRQVESRVRAAAPLSPSTPHEPMGSA